MVTRDIKYRIFQRWEALCSKMLEGSASPLEKSQFQVLKKMTDRLISSDDPPSSITTVKTRELTKLVDDAVMHNPVGYALYRFSWLGEAPEYMNGESFIRRAKESWDSLGENDQKRFRRRMMMVSDSETYEFLKQASNQQLFDVYMSVEVRYEEKSQAFNSLMRMANRTMKREEYKLWADKFGIKITESY